MKITSTHVNGTYEIFCLFLIEQWHHAIKWDNFKNQVPKYRRFKIQSWIWNLSDSSKAKHKFNPIIRQY